MGTRVSMVSNSSRSAASRAPTSPASTASVTPPATRRDRNDSRDLAARQRQSRSSLCSNCPERRRWQWRGASGLTRPETPGIDFSLNAGPNLEGGGNATSASGLASPGRDGDDAAGDRRADHVRRVIGGITKVAGDGTDAVQRPARRCALSIRTPARDSQPAREGHLTINVPGADPRA